MFKRSKSLDHFSQNLNKDFIGPKTNSNPNFFLRPKIFSVPKIFLGPTFFSNSNFIDPLKFSNPNVLTKNFFSAQNIFRGQKNLRIQILFITKSFLTQIFLGSKFILTPTSFYTYCSAWKGFVLRPYFYNLLTFCDQ